MVTAEKLIQAKPLIEQLEEIEEEEEGVKEEVQETLDIEFEK